MAQTTKERKKNQKQLKLKKKNVQKKINQKFSKSIPIKVWPQTKEQKNSKTTKQQKNKRKKKTIKIKETNQFEKQKTRIFKKFLSLTFFSSKIF